jgi:hypothetical protein
MECSNKGLCDRKEGICECFDGSEGSACQRASCPEGCSGHGTCEHIETLAGDVTYALWDTGMTMGCKCDPGYSGPDCSGRDCKYGIDPAYVDDDATARISEQFYEISGGSSATFPADAVSGTYAIKFYDVFGEDYVTEPITISTVDTTQGGCSDVVAALEGLPNTVIPAGSVYCSQSQSITASQSSGQTYSLTFTGNPGYLKPLTIDTYLDGARETVAPDTAGNTVATTVNTYQEGVSGEFVDYFASKCTGVVASISVDSNILGADGSAATVYGSTVGLYSYEMDSGYYLGSLTADESALLKKCLGDSDGNDSYGNNVEVYDWDYGSYKIGGQEVGEAYTYNLETVSSHPHAIKLVSATAADDYVGGLYYLTWYQSTMDKFVLINAPVKDTSDTASYYVYTTDGVVERVIVDIAGKGQITKGYAVTSQPPVTAWFEQYSNVMYTSYDVACETADSAVEPCLDQGDMLFVVDTKNLVLSQNVSYAGNTFDSADNVADSGDLYTISKIYKEDPTTSTFSLTGHEDRFRIVLDKNIPFAGTTTSTSTATATATVGSFGMKADNVNVGVVGLFKFTPATTGNYEFVSQCSGRGSCVDGICECFKGYTKDDCGTQSAYAV